MELLSILGQNLIGFDTFIFILAAANGVMYLLASRSARELYEKLRLVIFLPLSPMEGGFIRTKEEIFEVEDFVLLRERAERWYCIFANITGIFPLMGILGTVIALIPMVADMANVQSNFFSALTSTFWGLVFAIISKAADSVLAARMEDNDKNVALLLSRIRSKPEETV